MGSMRASPRNVKELKTYIYHTVKRSLGDVGRQLKSVFWRSPSPPDRTHNIWLFMDLSERNPESPPSGPTTGSAKEARRPRVAPTASPAAPSRWSHKARPASRQNPTGRPHYDGHGLRRRSVADPSPIRRQLRAVRARNRALAGAGGGLRQCHHRASIVSPALGIRPCRPAHPHHLLVDPAPPPHRPGRLDGSIHQ